MFCISIKAPYALFKFNVIKLSPHHRLHGVDRSKSHILYGKLHIIKSVYRL